MMNSGESKHSILVRIISKSSKGFFEDNLLKCMEKYHKNSTQELTCEEMIEFIVGEKIIGWEDFIEEIEIKSKESWLEKNGKD
jgi:hypothetical protein